MYCACSLELEPSAVEARFGEACEEWEAFCVGWGCVVIRVAVYEGFGILMDQDEVRGGTEPGLNVCGGEACLCVSEPEGEGGGSAGGGFSVLGDELCGDASCFEGDGVGGCPVGWCAGGALYFDGGADNDASEAFGGCVGEEAVLTACREGVGLTEGALSGGLGMLVREVCEVF